MRKHVDEQYIKEFMHIMLGIAGQKMGFVTKRSMEKMYRCKIIRCYNYYW